MLINIAEEEKQTEYFKNLLKPPFFAVPGEGDIVANSNISFVIEGEFKGRIDTWMAEALNEKYEREFEEPKRWIKDTLIRCSACKGLPSYQVFTNYCPSCGTRLLPPEIKERKEDDEEQKAIEKQIKKYISDSNTRVFIEYNNDAGPWEYHVTVVGEGFWLASFKTEKEALLYVEKHNLKSEGELKQYANSVNQYK